MSDGDGLSEAGVTGVTEEEGRGGNIGEVNEEPRGDVREERL
jgi:hypothetical protein